MQLLSLCAAILFTSSALSSESKEQPKELVVDVLELPASCDAKTATGDKISMHYVCFLTQIALTCISTTVWQTGTLFSNGDKFDSSCVVVPDAQKYTLTKLFFSALASHDRGNPLDLTREYSGQGAVY
jgi:hypothetical protein